MTPFRQFLVVIGLMAAATAFVALYLGTRQLVAGGIPTSEVPLIWCWDNITVHSGFNRWLDPLWAALWMFIPALMLLDNNKYDDLGLTPLYGLAAAGGFYLVFWGEPGVVIWPLIVPAALIIARISDLINERRAIADGYRWPHRFSFVQAIGFIFSFGLGLLLPMALMHGFVLAGFIWWVYCLLTIALCLAVFTPLWFIRLAIWLFRKIRLKG